MKSEHFASRLFHDPRVKAYFLHLMESSAAPEEKYQRLATFCSALPEGGLPGSPTFSIPTGAASCSHDDLLARIADSLKRAARRMQASQHADGGWGFRIEQSDVWGTGYALLFLQGIQSLPGMEAAVPVSEMLASGTTFLEQHPEQWAAENIAPDGALSVYDISLLVRCFYRLGRSFVRRESAQRVYRTIGRIFRAQNEDGGWDANIWGYQVATPTGVWSEVGATSAAVQALVQTHDTRFQAAVEKGLLWLAAAQNPDGSWNDGSCRPDRPAYQLTGSPAVLKTCDAVQAFLTADALDIPLQPFRAALERAVNWLLQVDQERRQRQVQAAVWGISFTHADYETAALVLETLSGYPYQEDALQSALVSAAAWLVESQRRQEGDPHDGSWVMGHTARTALALAIYYRLETDTFPLPPVPWIP